MNVLIIGLGSIAKKHIDALTAIAPARFKIYALRSGKGNGDVEGITNVFSLEDAGVSFDFAIVSNPTFNHYETLRSLSACRIPLFIEKPLFHNLLNGQALVDELSRNSPLTYVACNLRFHPCILYLKEMLATGTHRVNEVNVYGGSYLPEWRPGADFRKIYSANRSMGGGVHLDLIHELDYVTWLWGMPAEVRSTLRNRSSLAIDVVDYANYLLGYDDFSVNITLNYYRRDARRTCEIVFDDGTVTADLIGQKIMAGNELLFSSSASIHDTYTAQMKYFLSAMENRDLPAMNNIREAFEVLKICLNNE
ncbi:Gfo/Idh/MocA family oxidoreductase [Chitinophaga sp. YIM B06452]|uniref:Gfo/Idh/MocA family protein n=1 Tax=Chitinophaga sp. YIM B06452 TaxID=3082158 RepID=UPI0031FF0410